MSAKLVIETEVGRFRRSALDREELFRQACETIKTDWHIYNPTRVVSQESLIWSLSGDVAARYGLTDEERTKLRSYLVLVVLDDRTGVRQESGETRRFMRRRLCKFRLTFDFGAGEAGYSIIVELPGEWFANMSEVEAQDRIIEYAKEERKDVSKDDWPWLVGIEDITGVQEAAQPEPVFEPRQPNMDDEHVHVFPHIKQRDGRSFAYKFGRPLRPKDQLIGGNAPVKKVLVAPPMQLPLGLGEGRAKKIIKQVMRSRPGGWLESQADTNPIFYSHFDCWNESDGDDDDEMPYDDDSPEAQEIAVRVLRNMSEESGIDFTDLAAEYAASVAATGSKDALFQKVGQRFVDAHWYVYLSDTMIEVYAGEDLTANDLANVEHPGPVAEGESPRRMLHARRSAGLEFDLAGVAAKIKRECPWCMDNAQERIKMIGWITRNYELFPSWEAAREVILNVDSHGLCFDDTVDIYRFFKLCRLYSRDPEQDETI